MSYTPTTWVDGETQLSAENLNHIENQLGAIGTRKTNSATDVSVQTHTSTDLLSISLDAGTWVITGSVRFVSNATGYRAMSISTTPADVSWDGVDSSFIPAVNGSISKPTGTSIVSPTAATTYYLNARQTSGEALSVNGYISAVRIS